MSIVTNISMKILNLIPVHMSSKMFKKCKKLFLGEPASFIHDGAFDGDLSFNSGLPP